MNRNDFVEYKKNGRKITMLTCYDYWSAKLLADSAVDILFVGDSVAMVMHGYKNTLSCTIEMITSAVSAVRRADPKQFLLADLPFLSMRKSREQTMDAVHAVMAAGAEGIKIEGAAGNLETIAYIVESGVPVFGHIGLTPQMVHQLGGHKVQGKNAAAQRQLIQDAQNLESAGACAIVVECVPAPLAADISGMLTIPTIGIGAGNGADGQVLVLQDMLGLNSDFSAKFLKKFARGDKMLIDAVNTFCHEVVSGEFPDAEHSYAPPPPTL